ncbi:MAG: T9SS type A sorting domain-containing protein [candidate division WOR-3 bacterium]
MRWILILAALMGARHHIAGQNFFSDNIDLLGYSDAAWQIAEKDGNYYILTASYCDLSPYSCTGLMRLSDNFSMVWKNTIEITRIDRFTSMAVTDSCIYVGCRLLQPTDTLEITVLKFDFDGNILAQWYYGSRWANISYGISPAHDGGFVFLFDEVPPTGWITGKTYVARCNALGDVLWQKSLTGTSDVFSIHAAPDSTYVVGNIGHEKIDNNKYRTSGFVLKIDDDGNEVFRVVRDTSETIFQGNTFATYTKDGGAVFSRLREAPPGVWERQVIYRVDKTGNQLWEYDYPAQDYHRIWSIKEMRNGDILAVGFNENHPFIDTTEEYKRYWGGWLIRLSPAGEKRWERIIGDLRYPSGEFGDILDVVEASDGSLVAVGTILDTFPNGIPAPYNRDVWLLHLDSMGCVQPGCTGVFQGITDITKVFNLTKEAIDFVVSPNPAEDWISVSLPEGINVNGLAITLTDLTGRIRFETNWPRGQNTYSLNVASLPTGVYLLTLRDQSHIGTKKIFIQN